VKSKPACSNAQMKSPCMSHGSGRANKGSRSTKRYWQSIRGTFMVNANTHVYSLNNSKAQRRIANAPSSKVHIIIPIRLPRTMPSRLRMIPGSVFVLSIHCVLYSLSNTSFPWESKQPIQPPSQQTHYHPTSSD
jgi:hypothetical protein